jgi:hypothetical protein
MVHNHDGIKSNNSVIPQKEVSVKLFASCVAIVLLAGPLATPLRAGEFDEPLQRIQEAQAKSDAALVKQLARELSGLTSEVLRSPAPADAEEKASWAARVEAAKTAQLHGDYAMVVLALQSPPPVLVDLTLRSRR